MKKTTEALAKSMADAAVGPCDCDPHIEHCPSCAPYLHEPLKPAGEEDKATYKQIADNYTSPANCPRCAELQQDLQTTADALGHIQRQFEAVNQDRDYWIACHAKIFRKLQEANNTIAHQAARIEELAIDAAMANQAREIGNHFGLTYMQVWSDPSIASQVIDKMKEQQATIAQQAEQLAAAQAKIDALMLEYCPDEVTHEQLSSWASHQVTATPDEQAAIDAAIKASKEG